MFSSIIGHEKELNRVRLNIIRNPFGAFLFYGRSGIGKYKIAEEASKYLLCINKTDKCSCYSCQKMEQGQHPDLLCVGREGKILVSDIDQILDFVLTKPFLSSSKVVIIDNAHEISYMASNMLLKMLEETLNMTFFLITDNHKKLPETVLSRCLHFRFGNLTEGENRRIFKLLNQKKDVEVLSCLAHYLNVFQNPDMIIDLRNKAYEFIIGFKTRPLIESLVSIDGLSVEEQNLFVDLINIILSDIALLKQGVLNITNRDLSDKLNKQGEEINLTVLLIVMSFFSQIKKNKNLNINIGLNLKNVLIKSHGLWCS